MQTRALKARFNLVDYRTHARLNRAFSAAWFFLISQILGRRPRLALRRRLWREHYRAPGLHEGDAIAWFGIGTHEEYNRFRF